MDSSPAMSRVAVAHAVNLVIFIADLPVRRSNSGADAGVRSAASAEATELLEIRRTRSWGEGRRRTIVSTVYTGCL